MMNSRNLFFGKFLLVISVEMSASAADLAPLGSLQQISFRSKQVFLVIDQFREFSRGAYHHAQTLNLFAVEQSLKIFFSSFLDLSLVNQLGKRNKVNAIFNSRRRDDFRLFPSHEEQKL